MSQSTSFRKAEKAAANVNVLVIRTIVTHITTHAPTGNGLRMRPEIVVRNMARSCHAFLDSWWGFGTAKLKIRPMAKQIMRGRGLAPNFNSWRKEGKNLNRLEVGGGGGSGGRNSSEGECWFVIGGPVAWELRSTPRGTKEAHRTEMEGKLLSLMYFCE